jgi:hypothetical protein
MNPVYPADKASSDLLPVHQELKLVKAINAPGETRVLLLKPTEPIYYL